MSELTKETLIALFVGYCSYPIIKFIMIAIFDKIVLSIEDQVQTELENKDD